MSKWLASVQSLQEAQSLLPVLPDILDMKNPSQGALGALSVDIVSQIVKMINGRCHTSATIGDLPMQAAPIKQAIIDMTRSGVDYVKIGVFPDKDLANCLSQLSTTVTQLSTPVIAVLFADNMPDIECVPLLKATGFKGVMIDTAFKDGRHLSDHWNQSKLADFVKSAKHHDMLCGLAGALRVEDIEKLKPIGADYLGFRSALCQERQRTSTLTIDLAKQIQQLIITPIAKVA